MEGAWENRDQITDPNGLFVDANGKFLPDRAAVLIKNGLGEISRPNENRDPRQMAEFTNTVQKWMKENTRLGIPVLFHDECLHGHVAPKATSYPQAYRFGLELGSRSGSTMSSPRPPPKFAPAAPTNAWLRCLIWLAIRAGAARKKPTAKILIWFHDIGVAAVQAAFKEPALIDKNTSWPRLKHFAVHGQPEGGTNVVDWQLFGTCHPRIFSRSPSKSRVKQGQARSVMASYNEIDGIPSHSNRTCSTTSCATNGVSTE